jgi:hypothetical protein
VPHVRRKVRCGTPERLKKTPFHLLTAFCSGLRQLDPPGPAIQAVQDLLDHNQITTTQIYDKRRAPDGTKISRSLQSSRIERNRRRVEAAGGKLEHSLNLLPRYMKLLNDFLYARTCLKIFKNRSDGHPGIAKHPCAAASVSHAFDGWTSGPIETCHSLTLLYRNPVPRFGGFIAGASNTSHPP